MDLDKVMKIVEEGFETEKMRIKAMVEEEFESEKTRILAKVEEESESKKMRVLAKVEEELESAKARMLTKIDCYVKEWNHTTSARTHMKLELRNGIAQTILTSEEIKGDGGVPIEVALVDDPAGDIVKAEPEASANIEIVLLKGKTGASEGDDWTAEEFNANIIPRVEGKLPILAGNLSLQLHKGVAVLENISLRNHASKIKPPLFRLGVKAVNGDFRIKEAKTEPFTLKDYRAKYGKKHEKPSLSDKVSRLVCIAKGGKIAERLKDNKICTVEDFLTQLLINPQGLETAVALALFLRFEKDRYILALLAGLLQTVKSTEKNWEAMVNNARACVIGERVYCYMDLKQKRGIIFNLLGHVLGLYPESYYPQTSTLSENQKADAETLLASAFENWGEVKVFDDQNSLQRHLAGISTSLKPDCPEMVAESSTICSNASFHSACSTMDLYGQDIGSLSSVIDDMDMMMYDAKMQLNHGSPCSPSFFYGADECIQQIRGLMNESSGDEEGAATAAEPQVVSMRNRWKKMFCLLTWLVREGAFLDEIPRPKKQKLK